MFRFILSISELIPSSVKMMENELFALCNVNQIFVEYGYVPLDFSDPNKINIIGAFGDDGALMNKFGLKSGSNFGHFYY